MNPYVSITESLLVNMNRVQLREIPDKASSVTITSGGTTYSINDANSGGTDSTPTPTKCSVDFNQGQIFVDPSLSGLTLQVSYMGTGVILISTNRVASAFNNNSVSQTLADIIGAGVGSWTFKGSYNNTTAYVPNNVATWNNNAYICLVNSTGNLPSNTSFWQVFAASGSVTTISSINSDISITNPSTSPQLTVNSGISPNQLAKRDVNGNIPNNGLQSISISANTTLTPSQSGVILVTTAASTITLTLPTAVGNAQLSYIFKKVDSGVGTISLATTSSQLIDGISTKTVSGQYNYIQVVSDNANWQIIDGSNAATLNGNTPSVTVTPNSIVQRDGSGNINEVGILSNLTTLDKTSLVNSSIEETSRRKDIGYNVKDYNVSGSPQTTTGSITSGQPTLTLTSALDFKNGQGIAVNHAGSACTLTTPTWTTGASEVDLLTVTSGATVAGNVSVTLDGVVTTVALLISDNTPTLVATKIRAATFTGWTTGSTGTTVTFTSNTGGARTTPSYSAGTTGATGTMSVTTAGTTVPIVVNGTAGTTSYQYQIVALDANGGCTAAGTVGATATGNATLTTSNYIALSWIAVTSAVQYAIYGRVSGTMNLLKIVTATTFNDVGIAAITPPSILPVTPPVTTLADTLVTTISSGAGTATLTLSANATTTVSSAVVTHDDYVALNTLFNTTLTTASNVILPTGTYTLNNNLTIPSYINLIFSNGGILSPVINKTITINGTFQAGQYQIFSGFGTVAGSIISDKLYPQWWGAKGDGVTNDASAIQSAINAASSAGGGIVTFPTGNFLIKTQIVLKTGVSLVGQAGFSEASKASSIWVDNTATSAIVLESGTQVVEITFFYPNQTNTNVGIAVPYVFPSLFSLQTGGVTNIQIRSCNFINVYYIADFTASHGLITVKDCMGYAMYRGFVIDNCTEVDRFENVHFNPALWSGAFSPSDRSQWTRANAYCFHVKRADWIRIINCFGWGYCKGIYVQDGSTGSIGSGEFNNCGFDMTLTPIHIDAPSAWGINITNCSLVAQDPITTSAPHTAIQADNFLYGITISNCKFWAATGGAIGMTSTSGAPKNVEITNNQFISWGTSAIVSQVQYAIALQNIYNVVVSGNVCKGTNTNYIRGFSFISCPRLSVTNNVMGDMTDLGIAISESSGLPQANYYSVQGNIYQGTNTAISDTGTGTKKLVSNNVS